MNKGKSGKLTFFLVVALILYAGYVLGDQQRIIWARDAEIRSLQTKIEEQNKISNELKAQKEAVESDAYIEKIARERLGMVKPGEKVFIDINK